MGWSRERKTKGGTIRYTAYYRDVRGHTCVAGTFSSKRTADKAWQTAEARLAEGRVGDPRRGRRTFERYVNEEWLPHHVMEASTREGYVYQINKHILPWFGPMRMVEILPAHVREWVSHLHAEGVGAKTIQNLKNILSAIFTTALNDQVVFLHPCKGVKTPTVPRKPLRIITPQQFDAIYHALPGADVQLLVETAIETGLRWGELTELRVQDFDAPARIIAVCRAVVQLNPKHHPDGERFLVKEYPKDKEYRRVKVSRELADRLATHIADGARGQSDLIFAFRPDMRPRSRLRTLVNPETLGYTEPNDKGRRYRHGTLSGYNAGRCRCRHCQTAVAEYRARRRAVGRDKPRRPRGVSSDGHIPRDWFRTQVWKPALVSAGLEFHVRPHDLRHAHASWLLAGGADLQVVKERLGHASIATTEKYLHTLPDADETAVDAFMTIRNRRTSEGARSARGSRKATGQ